MQITSDITSRFGSVPCCTCNHPPCLDQSLYSSPPLCTTYHCLVQPSSSKQLQRQTGSCSHMTCILHASGILGKQIPADRHPQVVLQTCTDKISTSIPANEEVRTTLLMLPLDLATLSRTVDVPLSAGSTSSFCVSSHEAKKGDAM